MKYGKTLMFRTDSGGIVRAREFYQKPTDKLSEGAITDDGRVIYCRDEDAKLFWFADTEELLHLVDDDVK